MTTKPISTNTYSRSIDSTRNGTQRNIKNSKKSESS